MDSKQIFASGRNIKCYDKIKIVHQGTGWRLHANNKYYRDGSFNEVVSCHKARNDTDWFVVSAVDKEINHPNHNLRNGDDIVLTHMMSKKNLHTSVAYESPLSKNAEVSLCMSSGSHGCLEDMWKLQLIEPQDEYWRVGEVFRLVNLQAKNYYLYTHKKKMDDFGGDFEVCSAKFEGGDGKTVDQQHVQQSEQPGNVQDKSKDLNKQYRQWIVCENQPYIYTAPVVSSTKPKNKTQSEQFQRLRQIKKTRDTMKKKQRRADINQTSNLIKFYDESLSNRKPPPKRGCWKKYICCCCFPNEDPDEYYQHLVS